MNSLTQKTVLVGIDWADQTHAWHVQDGQAQTAGLLQQDATAIQDWIQQLRKQYPDSQFAVAIETTKGALISALLGHDDLTLYPINPAAMASYRKAFAHGGGKNDPGDAMLLCQYLKHYIAKLRPLRTESPLTRKLAAMAADRRRLVDQRTAHCNGLKAVLKTYFPEVLKLGAARIYADFIIAFLLKYPNLAVAQKAGATRLRKLFYGIGSRAKAEQRVQLLLDATALSDDSTLIETNSMRVVALVSLIQTYNAQIRIYAAQIAEAVVEHEDYAIFKSLPGASDLTHSRMIAAMGDDRTRYEDAGSLQAATGIAPLTTQSGKQRFVSARWACTKFLRQTFQEFAGLSIAKSKWAAAYYKFQLDKGKSPQMAKRALAYKWQRIIFRCWQDRVPYDEAKYIERLKKTGSPIYQLIKA
ncbi:IS110 family transposase [Mariniblastus fucicola]|uniref:Transposase n=1 Tax=Mariniblastus fucicola TaxID=980251 RepID=A0A5B9P9Q1_9BACT|nr:transposase [Mariniblastus fucicola]QEG21965.1 Transposase [Mariniblastus fucicola]